MSTEGSSDAESRGPGVLSQPQQHDDASGSASAAGASRDAIPTEGEQDRSRAKKSAPNTTTVQEGPTKKKRKLGLKANRILHKKPAIDLTGIPPQPLILKNGLSRSDYIDNSRRRPVKDGISSKYTGVYFDQQSGKWRAQIMVDGSVCSIGSYQSEEEAAADYARAAFKHKARGSHKLYGGMDLSDVPEDQPLIRSDTNASGYKGVKAMKGRWQARIGNGNGKHVTLGTFDTVEEAAGIYSRAVYYLEQKQEE